VLSQDDLRKYTDLLRRDVFRTTTRWPQFELLLSNLNELAAATPAGAHVVSVERNRLYGGRSLLRPIFQHCRFTSIDMTPKHNSDRGAYNEALVKEIGAEFGETIFECVAKFEDLSASNLLAPPSDVDVLLIPNLLHHVGSLPKFFSYIGSMLHDRTSGYLFDSTLREWHQIPDDYYRLTPWALKNELRSVNCHVTRTDTVGGPFDAIQYCWEQALEYLPEVERDQWREWLDNEHRPKLNELAERYPNNLVRQHSQFPSAYSIFFEKQ